MQLVKEEVESGLNLAKENELTLEMLPFHKEQQERVDSLKILIEALNERKKMISEKEKESSLWQRNEDKITLILTDIELSKFHSQKIQLQNQIDTEVKMYRDSFVEVQDRFKDTLEKAIEKNKKEVSRKNEFDITFKKYLDDMDFEKINANFAYKYLAYFQMKAYVHPNQENPIIRKKQ